MSLLTLSNKVLKRGGRALSFGGAPGPVPEPDTVLINGHVYKTVTIGNQEWMAENLNEVIGRKAPEGGDFTNTDCTYYNADDSYAATKYGLLYMWDSICTGNASGSTELENFPASEAMAAIIPAGWRLPTVADFQALMGGGLGDSATNWIDDSSWTELVRNPDTPYPFNAMASGFMYLNQFKGLGLETAIWTCTLTSYNSANALRLPTASLSGKVGFSQFHKDRAEKCSVRLVRDL